MGMAGRGNMTRLGHTYSVYVDDNYDLPPDDGRYKLGDFATLDEAVAACKRKVDEFLKVHASLDKTAEERYETYTQAGPDPFIVTDDPAARGRAFSAWDYAKERCQAG